MNPLKLSIQCAGSVMALVFASSGAPSGWVTNGPAIFQGSLQVVQGPAVAFSQPPADLPPEIKRDMLMFRAASNVRSVGGSSGRFDHYVPGSLNNLIWTNFI